MNNHCMVITFFYDDRINRVMDEDGDIVYDIFRYISPALYSLYRELRGTYYIKDKKDRELVYEFVFPTYEDEKWDDWDD